MVWNSLSDTLYIRIELANARNPFSLLPSMQYLFTDSRKGKTSHLCQETALTVIHSLFYRQLKMDSEIKETGHGSMQHGEIGQTINLFTSEPNTEQLVK